MGSQQEPRPLLVSESQNSKSSIRSSVFLSSLNEAQSLGELAARQFTDSGHPTVYIPSGSKIYTVAQNGDSFVPQTLIISNSKVSFIEYGVAQRTFEAAAEISARGSENFGLTGKFVPYYFVPNSI